MKESPIIEEVDQPRENRYWCPKCKAHKKPIVKVMKNYHSGEYGSTDKVIQKCSCGFREMYVPIECREDGERFRKLAAYLLGISCVILTTDFLVKLQDVLPNIAQIKVTDRYRSIQIVGADDFDRCAPTLFFAG